ncbi:MAG: biopolymer transporter ExbD [Deltaproteobacteria bacterium]|nr:biopolymer transporter ExbD [Deltaproteobacteria bacterium]
MAGASQDEDGLVAGINVTPLVDVCLVLLVILMVTARFIASNSMTLDLPKAAKGEATQLVFGVEVNATGELMVDGRKIIDDKLLIDEAKKGLAKNKDLRAVIRADKTVQHGRIIRVLDLLKQAGVSKIAFGVAPISAEIEGAKPSDAAPAKDGKPSN